MSARPYDQEQDPCFTDGLVVHCGRLAGTLAVLLAHPDSDVVRAFAHVSLNEFEDWKAGLVQSPLDDFIDEVLR